jgi:uncharacterized membrane protein
MMKLGCITVHRTLRIVQVLITVGVFAIISYVLWDAGLYNTLGIAFLWALAIFVSISAIHSLVQRRKKAPLAATSSDEEMTAEEIAPDEHKGELEEVSKGKDSKLPMFWVQLKVAVHELRLTLEHEASVEKRSTHIKEILTLLNRYDILIDMYSDELTIDEINIVLEDINECARLLKTPDLSR